METQTLRQSERGAAEFTPTQKYTLQLEAEIAEWAKRQPGGLSALVRRLLRREYGAAAVEQWQSSFERSKDALAAMVEEARRERKEGNTISLEAFLDEQATGTLT